MSLRPLAEFRANESVIVDGLVPVFRDRLTAALNDPRLRGEVLIEDGFRTYEMQEARYKFYGPKRAAKPGTSNHERGLSADVSRGGHDWLFVHRVFGDYGLYFPLLNVPNLDPEPWHTEADPNVGNVDLHIMEVQMALTPDEVEQIRQAVTNTILPTVGGDVSILTVLGRIYDEIKREDLLTARISVAVNKLIADQTTVLSAAITTALARQGISPDLVREAVSDAVHQTLIKAAAAVI